MTDKYIRIHVDSKGAKSKVDDLEKSMNKLGKSTDSSAFSLNKLAAAIAAVISVQKIVQVADAFNRVENQLRRTAKSTDDLAIATDALLKVSNETRTDLESTTELYTALSMSTQSLGVSQERVIGVTRTINQLFLESGKDSQTASNAIRQLGQALDAGALKGDEFIAISENAPGILKAIQQETGMTRKELREFGAQGKISAEILVTSLEKYRETAQLAADKTEATLAQAMIVARNNMMYFVGTLDNATGASSNLASMIINLSNKMASTESIEAIINFMEVAKLTIDSVAGSTSSLTNEFELLGDIGSESVSFLGQAFKNIVPNIKAFIEVIVVEAASVIDKFRISATTLYEVLSNPFDGDKIKSATDQYHAQMDNLNAVREDSIQLIFDEKEAIEKNAEAASKARMEAARARKAAADALTDGNIEGVGTITGGGGPARSDKEDSKVQNEINSQKEITRSLQTELEYRKQLTQIYNDEMLAEQSSIFDQERAQIAAEESERNADLMRKNADDLAKFAEAKARAFENDTLTVEEKKALQAEFDNQELLAAQILEEQLGQIRQKGVNNRKQIDELERKARIASFGALGASLMALGEGQSKKVFETGKALALASAAVSLPSAVLESFSNGGGYPWGLVPAGAMLATGLKNIADIKNAKFGSSPSASSAAAAPTPSGSTTETRGGGGGSFSVAGFDPKMLYSGEAIQGFGTALQGWWKNGGGDGNIIYTK
jgi:tape measure domain-containing protein